MKSRHRRQQTTNSSGEAGGEAKQSARQPLRSTRWRLPCLAVPESTGPKKDQRSYDMYYLPRRFKIEIDLHLSQIDYEGAPTVAEKMLHRGIQTNGMSREILQTMARSERSIYDPKLKFDYRSGSHVNNICRVKMIDWIDR